MSAVRRRRTKREARAEILAAAFRRLVDGGPPAVRVQLVAEDVGITDAAVHHHFGNRDGLLREVLRDGARTLVHRVVAIVERWQPDHPDLDALIETITRTYRDNGLARMVAWLALDGWKPRGRGMFRAIIAALHRGRSADRARAGRSREHAMFVTLLLNEVVWTEAFAGELFRRAADFSDKRDLQLRYLRWLARVLERELADPCSTA